MKTQWIALSSAALLVVILVAAGGCQVTRAGYETAPYRVTESDGAFQIREYPALQWVETPMGSGMGDTDGSFGRLFGFITGRNQSQQKIAMTTPVYMAGSPAQDSSSPRVMAFVMPKEMSATSVPV
ncbi:MAG: heme-binding protein, partial [Proteobacteria bacterium]|nr:heme-binding protein [Pseudomonadota bacterium]